MKEMKLAPLTGPVADFEGTPAADLAALQEQARAYAAAGRAARTIHEYDADWDHFMDWCGRQKLVALPALPATVVLYITAHASKLQPKTIGRRVMVVRLVHRNMGHPDPTADPAVNAVLAGVRRTHGTAPVRKAALVVDDLKKVVAAIPTTLTGHRDRALLLLGFATAMRRSELVALDVEDLTFSTQGLVVTVRRSKTDQEGEGRQIAVPYAQTPEMCAVRAMKGWLAVASITEGAIFRPIDRHDNVRDRRMTPHAVATIVKARAEAAGLDPENFSGHSLRAGFATSAAAVGLEEREIARQTGHTSMRVLRVYIRDGQMWQNNPVEKLGL